MIVEIKDVPCPGFSAYPGRCSFAPALIEHGFDQHPADFNPLGLMARAPRDGPGVVGLTPHGGNVGWRVIGYCV